MARLVCLRLTILILLALGLAQPSGAADGPLQSVGLYIWRDTPALHAFWKNCGYNVLQFCDTGWHQRPDRHAAIYSAFAGEIATVQREGFKADVILFSNIAQWKGPGETGPDVGDRFNPRQPEALKERLHYLTQTVRALKAADSFTFFAGDPGGAPPEIGEATVEDWLNMALEVEKVVRREAPHAEFNVNTWAITQWKDFGIAAWDTKFWREEDVLARWVANAPGFIGPKRGIQLPLHNYYRSMALLTYDRTGETPNPYPAAEDVRQLRARGTQRIWGWPYFLVDEADDGYMGPLWGTNGQAQAETRYLHRLIGQSRALGLDGLVANFSYKGYPAETLNTYAFGRFAHDPKATPERVLDEFAGFIATPASAPALGQILRFIENHSSWQSSLPARNRLANFELPDLDSAWLALRRLEAVEPNPKPALHLPEPPATYLKRLRERLEVMAAAERVPETSFVRPGAGEMFALSGGNWAGSAAATRGGEDEAAGRAADWAAAVVSSVRYDDMPPQRLSLPLELQRDHQPKALRVSFVSNNTQSSEGTIYWDGVRVGRVKPYADSGSRIATAELALPEPLKRPAAFAQGTHVLTVAIEKPTAPGYSAVTFQVDSLAIID